MEKLEKLNIKHKKMMMGNGYWRAGDYKEIIKDLLTLYLSTTDAKNKEVILKRIENIEGLYRDQQNRKRWDKFFSVFLIIGISMLLFTLLITTNQVMIPHSEEFLTAIFTFFLSEKIAIGAYLGIDIKRKRSYDN